MRGCSRGGRAWLLPGGACVVARVGGAWLVGGACMVGPGGMCIVGPGGGGACMVAPGGACVVAPGGGGHAWDTTRYGDMINERAVHILLECILV